MNEELAVLPAASGESAELERTEGIEGRILGQRMSGELSRGYLWYRRARGLEATDPEELESQKQRELERVGERTLASLSWHDLSLVGDLEPDRSVHLWLKIMQEAREDLDSGHQAARAVEVGDDSSPMERARFLVLRQSFAEDWKPRGGMEWALIDQITQALMMQEHWLKVLQVRIRNQQARDRQELDHMNSPARETRSIRGNWVAPRVSDVDAQEQAMGMVERWNRIYVRLQRQLRDLRRYAPPVVVNNGGQVNIAHQQVNGAVVSQEE